MEPETYLNSLQDGDIQIRAHSIIASGKTGNSEAVKPLIEILETRNEVDWLRGCAAIALGRISGEEVIEPLLNALHDDSMIVVRAVISSLGDVSRKRTIPYLEAILEDTDKAELHAVTVTVLGKIGGHDIMPTLLRELGRPDNQVRICAAIALSELRAPETVIQFMKLMDDEDECLRAIAASSLGLLRWFVLTDSLMRKVFLCEAFDRVVNPRPVFTAQTTSGVSDLSLLFVPPTRPCPLVQPPNRDTTGLFTNNRKRNRR